jgi:hypothetical protein
MQRAFTVVTSLQTAWGTHIARGLGRRLAQRGGCSALFRPSERFVETRLATICGVAMNDPTLGRFVDSRNRRANLIGGGLWRQADLFLQSAQVRLNASIIGRSSERLSGTFIG